MSKSLGTPCLAASRHTAAGEWRPISWMSSTQPSRCGVRPSRVARDGRTPPHAGYLRLPDDDGHHLIVVAFVALGDRVEGVGAQDQEVVAGRHTGQAERLVFGVAPAGGD